MRDAIRGLPGFPTSLKSDLFSATKSGGIKQFCPIFQRLFRHEQRPHIQSPTTKDSSILPCDHGWRFSNFPVRDRVSATGFELTGKSNVAV